MWLAEKLDWKGLTIRKNWMCLTEKICTLYISVSILTVYR